MARKIKDIESVKNALLENDITSILNKLLKSEKKDLKTISLIKSALEDSKIVDKIKKENDLLRKKDAKLFLYSKLMGVLSFYDKKDVLDAFLSSLSEKELKATALYEYRNKTTITCGSDIFDKHCLKYKIDFSEFPKYNEKLLELTQQIDKYNVMIKQRVKKNKSLFKKVTLTLILLFILIFSAYEIYTYKKIMVKYNGLIYPGIYVNEINISGKKDKEVKDILKEEEKQILSSNLSFKNINGTYDYTYTDLNMKLNTDDLYNDIIKYNNNLSFFKKLLLVSETRKIKVFHFESSYDEKEIDQFVEELKNNVNKSVKDDGLVMDDNYDVHYDKGDNGFVLDEEDTKEKIIELAKDIKEDLVINLEGNVTENKKINEKLSVIDTKISTYTTTFLNAGNRGHNIVLAASKLNGTVVYPNDEFSYNKVVGPYGSSYGYLPAPVYINGTVSTANGGGVCQLTSTLYNAELMAGLTTTSRSNHMFAPDYVPKGLDATVYSNTVDFRFKNELAYPIYITSYVIGGKLTVDIWSNSKAIEGKKFEPYSVYSSGGYLAYLNIYENDQLVETKYLDKSYYKSH